MVDDLYLEPNRKAQIFFLVTIIIAAILYASLDPIINSLTPSSNSPLEELEAGAKFLNLLALSTNIIWIIISLFWVGYFSRKAYRTLKFGSYPPSGTIVIRRIKIQTGRQAIIAGYLCILFAVLMGLSTIGIGYLIWKFTITL